ncbi:MAG TPA: methyl-accepting chemotaxis protein [Actinoplanes sp.]|nr:methyl-accepting chemotaxis protein [Actinoplanes sp.]
MRTKLALIVGVALAGLVISTVVGISGLGKAEQSARALQVSAQLTRTALEADMAHDAIRGDVLRALFAASAAERAEAGTDLGDHVGVMRDRLGVLRSEQAPAAVRAAADQVDDMVENYLRSATTVVAEPAGAGRDSGYRQFSDDFTTVEDGLPAVGDALDTYAAAIASGVDQQKSAGTRALIVSAAIAAVLLLMMATMITRSVLSALRQVSDALVAVAGGDLSRRAEVTGGDEFADMAGQVNSVITGMRETIAAVTDSAATVADSTNRMTAVSQKISAAAERATGHAGTTAGAADAVARNIDTTASGNQQMGASIAEIARSTTDAARVVAEAVVMAERASTIMSQLGASSSEIGDVVKAITAIAGQTNLLALNATIEAARAGESGKGFAVVAGEVKDLAQETARATQDISTRVEAIQIGSTGAVQAIEEIAAVIQRINELQTTIASAVDQQSVTAAEMTRNMSEAAGRSGEITSAINTVAVDASATAQDAQTALAAARDLTDMTQQLHALVARFRT